MDNRDSAPPGEADFTAAVPLEISEETASRTDDLLREFAEDAGLDTALVVDRSGALVAGISAEADVTVEVISALVAGASGAMRALVAQLGETGALESLHLGGNRLIYLKETVHRFVLVAVAEASRPAGLVRQKALAIEGRLAELLRDVRPVELPPPSPAEPAPIVRSLRETVRERAALRQAVPPPIPPVIPAATEPIFELDAGDEDEEEEEEDDFLYEDDAFAEEEVLPEVVSEVEEPVVLPCDEEPRIDETFETLDLQPELEDEVAEETEPSSSVEPTLSSPPEELPPPVPVVPREILEPIDFGEPEIVIEPALPVQGAAQAPPKPQLPVDSPFEAEEEEDEDLEIESDLKPAGADSVFEYDGDEENEDEDDELIVEVSPVAEEEDPAPVSMVPPPLPVSPPASLFEEDDGDDEEDDPFEDELEDELEDEFDDELDQELDDEEEVDEPAGLFEDDEDEPVADEPATEEFREAFGGIQETILFEMPPEPEPAPAPKRKKPAPVPPEPADEGARELVEMIDEEEEESEIRSSGPFYF